MFWTDKRPYKKFEFYFDTFGKENGNSKSIIHSPKSIHYFVSLFYFGYFGIYFKSVLWKIFKNLVKIFFFCLFFNFQIVSAIC